MSLGKGGEGGENGICPSLLACYYITLCSVFIYESQPFLSYSVVLERALFCSYGIALILSVSSLAVSLFFIQDVVLLLVYHGSASKCPLFSLSNADRHAKTTTNGRLDCLHIYYLILFRHSGNVCVCVCSHQGCGKGCVVLTSKDLCVRPKTPAASADQMVQRGQVLLMCGAV